MTSAEFVAKYKLFKPIAERGARSFLAQEVQGHRAVLVHRLDIAPADENRRLLLGVESVRPDERSSIIEVTDVDGVAVVVTRFTPDFQDLPSWLAERGRQDPAPHIDAATPAPGSGPLPFRSGAPPPVAPPPAPKPAGEFTQLFGASLARPADTPAASPFAQSTHPPAPPMPPAVPRATAPAPATPRAPVPPSTPVPGEFTQLFKGFGATSEPPPIEPPGPAAPQMPSSPAPRTDSSWPPSPAVPQAANPPWPSAPSPSSAPPSPPPGAPVRGEFTQLFHGFANPTPPTGGSAFPPPPPPAPPPFGATGSPHTSSPGGLSAFPPPGAGAAPSMGGPVFGGPVRGTSSSGQPPAPPSFGTAFGAAPSPAPPGASFGGPPLLGGPFGDSAPPPAAAPSAGGGSLFGAPQGAPPIMPAAPQGAPPIMPAAPPGSGFPGMATRGEPAAAAGASEFTRMLGAIAPPRGPAAPPPLPVAPAPAAPAPAAGAGSGAGIKTYLPLILAVNVVLIAATGVILYLALKP